MFFIFVWGFRGFVVHITKSIIRSFFRSGSLIDFIKGASESYGGLAEEIVRQGEVEMEKECGNYGPVTNIVMHIVAFFLTLLMLDL